MYNEIQPAVIQNIHNAIKNYDDNVFEIQDASFGIIVHWKGFEKITIRITYDPKYDFYTIVACYPYFASLLTGNLSDKENTRILWWSNMENFRRIGGFHGCGWRPGIDMFRYSFFLVEEDFEDNFMENFKVCIVYIKLFYETMLKNYTLSIPKQSNREAEEITNGTK